MPFISRYIGVNKYGVVDTDDGVEEVVTSADIGRTVNFLHIPIVGVDVSH